MQALVLGRIGEVLDHVNDFFESRSRSLHSNKKLTTGFTVAISREAGTPDRQIAQELGARLGWPIFDHELLQILAARTGWPLHALEEADERHVSWVQQSFESFLQFPGVHEDAFVHRLVELIQELGTTGDCILVGRGAGHMLPDETTLRVRLVAPRQDRVAQVACEQQISSAAASRYVDRLDRCRHDFVAKHFFRDVADPAHYTLTLNTSQLSVAESVDLIADALRCRYRATVARLAG